MHPILASLIKVYLNVKCPQSTKEKYSMPSPCSQSQKTRRAELTFTAGIFFLISFHKENSTSPPFALHWQQISSIQGQHSWAITLDTAITFVRLCIGHVEVFGQQCAGTVCKQQAWHKNRNAGGQLHHRIGCRITWNLAKVIVRLKVIGQEYCSRF